MLLVQVKDQRLAVLYRRSGSNFRGRLYNHETDQWNATSSIPINDITCWRSTDPHLSEDETGPWQIRRAAALASMPPTERVDEIVANIKAAAFDERRKTAQR